MNRILPAFLLLVSTAHALTFEEAVTLASSQNPEIRLADQTIAKLDSQKDLIQSNYSDKLSLNASLQRDSEHLNELYVNDLYQRNFIDYGFSESSLSVNYNRTLLNDSEANQLKVVDLKMRNQRILRERLVQMIQNRIRLVFFRIAVLRNEQEDYRKETLKLEELKKFAKKNISANSPISRQLQLLSAEKNSADAQIQIIDENIKSELSQISLLVGQKVQGEDLEDDVPGLEFQTGDYQGDLKDTEELILDLMGNNEERFSSELAVLRTSDTNPEVQYGVRYYQGFQILDFSMTNLKSLNINDTFTDNYGSQGFYKGFYGNGEEQGALFYVNFEYQLFGDNIPDQVKDRQTEQDRERLLNSNNRDEFLRNVEGAEGRIRIAVINISTEKKNISILENGLDPYLHQYENGRVRFEDILDYLRKAYEEKIQLSVQRLNYSEELEYLYQLMDGLLNRYLQEY